MSAHTFRQRDALARVAARILCWHIGDRRGWFRLFGIGLAWTDTRIHGLMFSERYGYCKRVQIGAWSIRYLPRWRSLDGTPVRPAAPWWLWFALIGGAATVGFMKLMEALP